MNDFEIIRLALKESKRLAFDMRYGGLGELYKLCAKALQSLERIEQDSVMDLPLFSPALTQPDASRAISPDS
jgi:hypothetical protein